jgi:catechol 2,3-dioxygenase-like lactoylglutathione lyase family enzyme
MTHVRQQLPVWIALCKLFYRIYFLANTICCRSFFVAVPFVETTYLHSKICFHNMNLNQVTIPVLQMERAIKFYELLGLQLIVKAPQYARFICPQGDASFSLHEVTQLPQGEGAWIYFEVDDPDAIVQQLLTKGISVDEMPEDKTWLWREARLKDPDNNQLIIYHAGHNRKNPPWRIS